MNEQDVLHGAWQRMLSGLRLNILDPSPNDINIVDAARGLSRIPRWNGQTTGEYAFSIAQHSVLVENIVSTIKPDAGKEERLMALLHDVPEYVIGDVITPFKRALGDTYKRFEDGLERAVTIKFIGKYPLKQEVHDLVKIGDKAAAYLESTIIGGFSDSEASYYFGKPPQSLPAKFIKNLDLSALPAEEAALMFIEAFEAIHRLP
jgi:5'-deoxynucleotidase YfbR-like HD superfamily hydrolase